MRNIILEKYMAGEKSLGTFSGLNSTAAVESLGLTGLDYVLVDCEHSSIDRAAVGDYMSIIKAQNMTPLVRINSASSASVQWSLDAGAMGIIVPRIETPDQVEKLVRLAKYTPLGNRGFGPSRDGGWMHGIEMQQGGIPLLMKEANAKTMLIPQCETVGCLEHVEEIISMDGVDSVMVGPYDLSIAMGMPGEFERPEFKAALERVRDACRAAKKPSIIFTANPDSIKPYYDLGYDSVIYSVDIFAVIRHFRDIVKSVKG